MIKYSGIVIKRKAHLQSNWDPQRSSSLLSNGEQISLPSEEGGGGEKNKIKKTPNVIRVIIYLL